MDEQKFKAILKSRLESGKMTREEGIAAFKKYKSMRGAGPAALPETVEAAPAPMAEPTMDMGVPDMAPPAPAVTPTPMVDPTPEPMTFGQVGRVKPTGRPEQPMPIMDQLGQGVEAVQSLGDKIAEIFTASERRTKKSESLPDWVSIPELQIGESVGAGKGWQGFKTAFGTMFADPGEIAQVFKSNFPDMNVTTDEKGNYILQSTIDGKEYAIKPGFRASDVPRAATGVATGFAVPAAGRSLFGRVLSELGLQTLIEGSQAATGGEANVEDIAMAGAFPLVTGAPGQVGRVLRKGVDDVVPPVPKATVAEGVADPSKVVGNTVGEAPTPPMPDDKTAGDLAKQLKKSKRSKSARKKAAAQLVPSEQRQQFAEETLGIRTTPVDVLSDSLEAKAVAGVPRKVQDSEAFKEWSGFVKEASDKTDKILEDLGATYGRGGASLPDVAEEAKNSIIKIKDDLKEKARVTYREKTKAVPDNTVLDMSETRSYLAELEDSMGEDMPGLLKGLIKQIDDGQVKFGGLKFKKSMIRQALERKSNVYSESLDESILNKLKKSFDADEIENVRAIGGDDMAEELKLAHKQWAIASDYDEKLIKAYGRDGLGELGGQLSTAFRNIDTSKDFDRIIASIPKELRPKVILTGIAESSVSKAQTSMTKGGFGSSEFPEFMRKLGKNTKRLELVKESLGEDNWKILEGLEDYHKSITEARAFGPKGTGADLLEAVRAIDAENFVASFLESPFVAGAASKLPVVGKAGDMIIGGIAGLAKTGGDAGRKAVGEALNDKKLKKEIVKAVAKGEPKETFAKRMAVNPPFRKFARSAGLPMKPQDLERWILSSMRTTQTMKDEQDGN